MTRPLALVFAAAFVLLPRAASAKPKIALTQIEGDASGDVRDAVVEALEGKELSLIGSKEVNRAVDKLGDLADLTEKDFKKLANELEADAIVAGKLDKIGSARTLKFRLFIHKKMAKGFTVSFKDAKSEKFRSALHDKMLDKIGVVAGDGEDEKPARQKKGSDDEDDPLATKKDTKAAKKAEADDEEQTRPKKPKASDDEDARPRKSRVADHRSDGDDEEAPRKAKKKVAVPDDRDDGDDVEGGVTTRIDAPHAANRVAFRLDVGVSVLQRTLKFNANNFPEAPKSVALSPVPGARFEAEVYPLALSSPSSAAAGLGAAVEYDKTIKLNLVTTNAMSTVTAPVKQSHYSIGVRYRLAFGTTETSPTLTLGVGYGKRLFSPDHSQVTDAQANQDILRDTPQTQYVVIDPGFMLRFPVTRMVAFAAGGRGMIITEAGSIQNGNSYGRAKVYGAEALAAVDVVLGNHFALRFAGEFVQIGFQFQGVGALSNGLDGDPTTADVGGLSDRSIGGSATLAVMY